MRTKTQTDLDAWATSCRNLGAAYRAMDPQTSYLVDLARYMDIKADWMELFLENPDLSIFRNSGFYTHAPAKNPFRVTREEIRTEKEDLNNQPWGKHGHPDPPGMQSAAELIAEEDKMKTLKRKFPTRFDDPPAPAPPAPAKGVYLRRSRRLASKTEEGKEKEADNKKFPEIFLE
jgi:hypothetical protein